MTVKTNNGTAGVGSYEYYDATRALTIRIVQSLFLNTAYTITISAQVKDRAGNALAQPVTSTFTTDVCPKARKGRPAFDMPVWTIAKSGCTLYVGGEFTQVGDGQNFGTMVDPTIGQKVDTFTYEDINEQVLAVIPDGDGGWYIAGDFTRVGNYTRNHLARIRANGEVLAWNPNANGKVRTLAMGTVNGETAIFLGGDFTTIGGASRNHVAAVATNGSVLSWNPSANGNVRTIAILGSVVYLGGDFTSVGCPSGCSVEPAEARNRLAAIGTDGSLSAAWNPAANNPIHSLVATGSVVYIGGISPRSVVPRGVRSHQTKRATG